ncbi:Predicted DNA-binding transcriptional regulator YafY, contains an HTH and WYL domains [Chitinophaga sp. CF118]|uniref:helix-turn-helix transcriptional regulator n=1 Tax=Chitinophaga sp. CF118 TaxID=1884367 RepID=UPI0008E1FCE9|nr:YafY family protein [Chitinophaga sp. CF118]SFD27323.1 Predicted DNA-binding transcriptional regulator YafY, contains an HTH and WYL domains [Chitinophaga sp. CF118]
MNRIDRLSAILIQLQGKKVVRASEIADRFNISLRTVYRDVKALQEAGVPVGAEAGTGYYLVEGYHLPPVMFSREEAAALLTGEKLMTHLSDHSNRKQFSNAMQKIKAVLRGSEKDFLESLEDNIAVVSRRVPVPDEFPNRFMSDIQHSLGKQLVLELDYFAYHNDTLTHREAEPIGIIYMSGNWHLIAWCKLRNGYRDFRMDRIKNLSLTNTAFDKSKHLSLKEYMDKYSEPDTPSHLIKLRVPLAIGRRIGENKFYYGFVEELVNGEHMEFTFLSPCLNWFGRWLLMWGRHVEIICPKELTAEMKLLTTELKEHYM